MLIVQNINEIIGFFFKEMYLVSNRYHNYNCTISELIKYIDNDYYDLHPETSWFTYLVKMFNIEKEI